MMILLVGQDASLRQIGRGQFYLKVHQVLGRHLLLASLLIKRVFHCCMFPWRS
nr:hypothetical protein Iba_chr04aCG3820 [Ipomoea batatas]GMC81425.1 hypothetical protein Iba_chr04bCG3860 [Ipomoea batatas]GMC81426.1 hypothetical protein Iba_chr04bCG3870 [Ipomoea batatas]GMC83695.1 hypothetical protein Iba_chr04cCG4530 [Ipomoea batatas]